MYRGDYCWCYVTGGGSREDLEEEYQRAIATNIVQELLFRKKQREKDEREQEGRNSKTGSATIRNTAREADKVDVIVVAAPIRCEYWMYCFRCKHLQGMLLFNSHVFVQLIMLLLYYLHF